MGATGRRGTHARSRRAGLSARLTGASDFLLGTWQAHAPLLPRSHCWPVGQAGASHTAVKLAEARQLGLSVGQGLAGLQGSATHWPPLVHSWLAGQGWLALHCAVGVAALTHWKQPFCLAQV